ncbi:two-partner secretion domain-containing protein [Nostoc sp. CMAA1605]|uniref:two-partner secretion domain-containing protein n=1 Tax=Nostoc sp. CMAA1605 TaxID=2055159 RepID=UPI001F366E67|nr:filamentous hemagglutinin N-terminal domain-containing protein [Nostoc sp. CMAA1605]
MFCNNCVHAQIAPDGSFHTKVTQDGNHFTITNGSAAGTNLFHSFHEFSVPANGSAKFDLLKTPQITTIFSRVTGGKASQIEGAIQTLNNQQPVSLFLINPAGIIFGKDASLNIGGSFVGTTANNVVFADGFNFSATNTTTPPLLTISVPIGLQFGQNPADINILSGSQLQVLQGKTFALVGGNIFADSRTISTPEGRIELGAVNGGTVSLTPNSQGWQLGYQAVPDFGNINLSNQSIISTGGKGEIHLWGADISLSGGSRLSIQNTTNSQTPGKISVHSSNLLTVTGDNQNGSLTSAIRAGATGTGMVSNIEIFTQDLIANNGGIILTNNSSSSVGGGNIQVNASRSIEVAGVGKRPSNRSGISGLTFLSGKGGDVNVSTSRLFILDGAVVTTSTLGTGSAGNVTVNATESIHLAGVETASTSFAPSSLSSSTLAVGNSGNLIVNTARLSVHHGARVEASSYASGDAGNVIIRASDSLEVSGSPSLSFLIPSFVGSSTVQQAGSSRVLTGDSGDVHITTAQLKVANGGLINVRNDGTGNAGKVKVNANSIMLGNQGAITAATQVGEGGDIAINANTLLMRHGSVINATSNAVGNGGNITIHAPIIVGLENSDIVANAVRGKGGNIDITTQGILGLKFRHQLTAENDITASSEIGLSGTVQVNTIGVDPNAGLLELPENVTDPSQQIATGCADASSSSFIATGRGGIPQNPMQEVRSDRTWSDTRDISAFPTAPQIQAKISQSPQLLVQATSWHRNAQGKIELITNQSPTQAKPALTCAAVPNTN